VRGLELTREPFVENVPTFEVRGLIRGAETFGTFEDIGLESTGSLNDSAFDGVTDYTDGEIVLLYQSRRFDEELVAFVDSPELDGLYGIVTIGHSHQNPMLERIPTNASLFEVEVGMRYGGTFWKNLTLSTGYIPNVSHFVLEELIQLEP
jgi:hypothetical protein